MKILVVSPRIPWPPRDGGQMGIALHLELLTQAHECRLVAGRGPGASRAAPQVPAALALAPPDVVDLDLPSPMWSYARSLGTPWPATLHRYRSRALAERIREIAGGWRPDVAIAEHLHMAYLREVVPEIPWLAVSHNVETLFLERVSRSHHFPMRALYQIEARRMRALEPRLLAGADAVIAVDEQEADWIRARVTATPVHTVPFGVPIRTQPKPERTEGFLILGSWSWEPNREAAGWFVREVWPLVRATSAEAKATIAGRDSGPAGLGSGAADVLWAGEVPEVESYLLAARALVVPLLTGAGLRVKILEAMSYGTAVITTPEGLGGLSPVDGVHVLVARGPRAMADAVMSLERDPERARRIGEAGRAWVTERFGLPIVRGRLYAAVQDGADRGRARLSKT